MYRSRLQFINFDFVAGGQENKDSTLKVKMSTFLHSPKAQQRLNDLWNNSEGH